MLAVNQESMKLIKRGNTLYASVKRSKYEAIEELIIK